MMITAGFVRQTLAAQAVKSTRKRHFVPPPGERDRLIQALIIEMSLLAQADRLDPLPSGSFASFCEMF